MSEEVKPKPGPLDQASKLLTIVSLAVAVFAAWKALPMDAEIKQLQAQTQRLDLSLKQAEAELRGQESARKLSLDLYQEVKKVIEKKDKNPREEDALRVLVESLAEDPFRYKLLTVIAIGATSEDVKSAAKESSTFFREELQVQQDARARPAAAPEAAPVAGGATGSYNIDLFYCEAQRAVAEPLARAVLAARQAGDKGRWRVRSLPESVNQQPGYGVASSEVRFNAPLERAVADVMLARLAAQGVRASLRESASPTPAYLSVFICPA
jgi:hypothetical protein